MTGASCYFAMQGDEEVMGQERPTCAQRLPRQKKLLKAFNL